MNLSAKTPNSPKLSLALAVAGAVVAFWTPGGAALAQPKPAAAAAAAASPEQVLEDKLMSALASQDMDSLLEHYFKKHNVSPERQEVVRSISAWKELSNPNLPVGKKRQLLAAGVKGIKQFLAANTNTEILMRRANELLLYGVKGQVDQIEYFGPTPSTQAELNASADAAIKLLDKVAEECEIQENQVLAGQVRPNKAIMDKWTALDERAQTAKWTRSFTAYALAISMDPADPKRKEVADAAITFLTDFEKPEFQREATVKIQLGKLLGAKGETDAAVAKLKEALQAKPIEKAQQYEALFAITLANLTGKKADAAVASAAELQKWVTENLPAEADQKAVAPGIGLVDYRIIELQAELAADAAAKQKFAAAGGAKLNQLMTDFPNLAPVIKKMLLAKLPPDADLTKTETVLLRALLAKGVDEVRRAGDGLAKDDGKPALEQGVKAANEILARAGAAKDAPTPDALLEASYLKLIFFQKLGNHLECGLASLDFLKAYSKDKDRAPYALRSALLAVEEIRKDKATDLQNAKVADLISRAWQTAVASGRTEYAFVYGKRLLDQAKYKDAAAALHLVPEDNKVIVHARFYELTALQQMMDDKALDAPAKAAVTDGIQKVAADLNKRIDTAVTTATEDQQPRLKYYQVSAVTQLAEIALKQNKDYQGVLTALTGFEAKAKGLPMEESLVGSALRLRIAAYMGLGKTNEAVDEVQKLVSSGGSAGNVLYELIKQMEEGYQRAKAAKDTETMRENSAISVALIGPLIKQTTKPEAKASLERWEADLLVRTAMIETDPAKKTEYLKKAQAVFDREVAKTEDGTPARDSLRYKLALISYQLKDYAKVQQEMGQLIAASRLGPPDMRKNDPTGISDTVTPNAVYWEGLLRFMQANYELAKADPNNADLKAAVENSKQVLRGHYINRGENVGGPLREEYLAFKKQLLGDWDETKISIAATKPAATKPAAAPAPAVAPAAPAKP